MVMDEFHVRLKEARTARYDSVRQKAKYTQSGVAKAICIARQTYLDMEYGKSYPRLNVLYRIAKHLNVDPAWLAFGVAGTGFNDFNQNPTVALFVNGERMEVTRAKK